MKKAISLILILTLFLTANLSRADYTFGTVTNVGMPVNSFADEAEPDISSDGLELYFVSGGLVPRDDGYGEADLYVAKRITKGDDWGEPMNLGPTVNSSAWDAAPNISADGLSLFFESQRAGGYGGTDIYVTIRPTKDDPWGAPINLGSIVNTSDTDSSPDISADGLSLIFTSDRPGGSGNYDIWLVTRASPSDPWDTAVNLGILNTSGHEGASNLSSDGRMMFFFGFNRPGHPINVDIWMTSRATENDEWANPIKLGPEINGSAFDTAPSISSDGSVMYFTSTRPGGLGEPGDFDLWQVSIDPVVDLNSDGIVDADDMCIIVDNWGTDNSLCDIGPMPWGDGIVDVEDLIVLAEHLFEEVPPVETELAE